MKNDIRKTFLTYLKEVAPNIKCTGWKSMSKTAKFKCSTCKKTTVETPNKIIQRGGCCIVLGKRFLYEQGKVTCRKCKNSWNTNPLIAAAYVKCPACLNPGSMNVVYLEGIRITEVWVKVKNKVAKVDVTDDFNWTLLQAFIVQSKKNGIKPVLVKEGTAFKGELTKEKIEKWHNSSLKRIRILGVDPGSSNFAWSVIEVTRPFKVKVVSTGMLKSPLKSLVGDVALPIESYKKEVLGILQEVEVDIICVERFMTRGLKGVTIELINVMIGVLISLGTPCKLIIASQWKNEWNKRDSLEDFYLKVPCTVHQVDSIGIALYLAYSLFKEIPYSNITKLGKTLVAQIGNLK